MGFKFSQMITYVAIMVFYILGCAVGSLETDLPADDSRTTTRAGDIVLYNGNQIVVFYGSNSWSYTRIGKIDDLSGWEDALGSGDVTVTFSLG